MTTLPNILSALRFPLAFLFLSENLYLRVLAIVLAMITDGLDGFIARHYKQTSVFGRILDPIADKFFVLFLILILFTENNLSIFQALSFFSRDFAVLSFGIFLFASSQLKSYHYKPFWCGKITTALQFFTLLSLSLKISVPSFIYILFLLLGFLALIELFYPMLAKKKMSKT